MEKWRIRTSPLGEDRYYNRYWWFHHDERIFVESPDSKEWGYYSNKEEVLILVACYVCIFFYNYFCSNSLLVCLNSLMR